MLECCKILETFTFLKMLTLNYKIHSMHLTVMKVMNIAGLCLILLWPVDDASSYGN